MNICKHSATDRKQQIAFHVSILPICRSNGLLKKVMRFKCVLFYLPKEKSLFIHLSVVRWNFLAGCEYSPPALPSIDTCQTFAFLFSTHFNLKLPKGIKRIDFQVKVVACIFQHCNTSRTKKIKEKEEEKEEGRTANNKVSEWEVLLWDFIQLNFDQRCAVRTYIDIFAV